MSTICILGELVVEGLPLVLSGEEKGKGKVPTSWLQLYLYKIFNIVVAGPIVEVEEPIITLLRIAFPFPREIGPIFPVYFEYIGRRLYWFFIIFLRTPDHACR